MRVEGMAEPGFGLVAEAFGRNFEAGEESGAAVCVYHDGRKVVDLWCGMQDAAARRPWDEHTVVPVLSTGKGVTAAAALIAASRGQFDLDQPVAAFWPAFAANGKEAIRVRDLLDHSAGLVFFGRIVTRGEFADHDARIAILEQMTPDWSPGTRCGYHLATFGPLVAEVISRTDPLGRSFGQWFQDEVALPAELRFRFGISADEIGDMARVEGPWVPRFVAALGHAPFGLVRQTLNPFSRLHRTFREIPDINLNDPDWLALEFPSANGIGEARAIARLYAMLASPDESPLAPHILRDLLAPQSPPPFGRRDAVMGVETNWHLGFVRPGGGFAYSPSPRAFGMPGLGGSFGFCDPDRHIGYAYTPNRLGPLPFDDPREQRVRQAVYAALDCVAATAEPAHAA